MTRQVHLVGSIPLATTDDVFGAVGETLGSRISRVPDGETGLRSNWVATQAPVLEAATGLQRASERVGAPQIPGALISPFLGAGDGTEVQVPPLGYATAATESYKQFREARARGLFPASTKFQVSMSTPLSPLQLFVVERARPRVEEAYRRRLAAEVHAVTSAIPHEDLAIQWEIVAEVALLEGVLGSIPDNTLQAVAVDVAATAALVPDTVQMGFHFCYGDIGREHFVQPTDAGLVAELAGAIAGRLHRPIDWIHLPVPANRDDKAYTAPLTDLDRVAIRQVFLGLIHERDGFDGAARRAAAATANIKHFGVATACGLGRRDPETIVPLLRLMADVADAV